MAIGTSTWYLGPQSQLARVDLVDGIAHWTGPTDIGKVFPALLSMGLYRDRILSDAKTVVGEITWVVPTDINEVVFQVAFGTFISGFDIVFHRSVRIDLCSGSVVEYPASSSGADGWRRYDVRDEEFWSVDNAVTGQSIAVHPWGEAVFAARPGSEPSMGALPSQNELLTVERGKLYFKAMEPQGAYIVYDLANLTTTGTIGLPVGDADAPTEFDVLWTIENTDADAWRAIRPAAEFDRDTLTAITDCAHETGVDFEVLLTVFYAESGLRTDAYHPAGRYGLLQLTAEQLSAAGWGDSPEDYLTAGAGQLAAIKNHVNSLAIPADASETLAWMCHLLGEVPDLDESELTVTIAAPGGPRPELWTSHGIADMNGDGQLSAEDLLIYMRSLRDHPRLRELVMRTEEMSAVIPAWQSLAEVSGGDDTGGLPLSAASLGLKVDVVAVQGQPGFIDEQVVSIEPAPGTLQRLVDPVEVRINFVS